MQSSGRRPDSGAGELGMQPAGPGPVVAGWHESSEARSPRAAGGRPPTRAHLGSRWAAVFTSCCAFTVRPILSCPLTVTGNLPVL